MEIIQIFQASGQYWLGAVSLYRNVFPKWEREPVVGLANRINSGDSRCVLVVNDETVVGMSLCDLRNEKKYLLLSYLLVKNEYRGQGLGKLLCKELLGFFAENKQTYHYFLLEAKSNIVSFYQKFEFTAYNFIYMSPHFDDDSSTEMSLMHLQQESIINKNMLKTIITDIFCFGYYLPPNDSRLCQQLQVVEETLENNLMEN